ncbi:MAG: LysR family transcriptional regulator [Pseudomonas sp.]
MRERCTSHNLMFDQENSEPGRDLPNTMVDLYWLLQAVNGGSLSAAAQHLGVSKSSLSRRLSQLETRLGVQLAHRGPRRFSLTSTGEAIYRHALAMVDAVEAAVECAHLAQNEPGGQVRLSMPTILTDCLIPVLADFRRQYPQIELHLLTDDHPRDLAASQTDLALSLREAPADSLQIVSRTLVQLPFATLATRGAVTAAKRKPAANSAPMRPTGIRSGSLLIAREAAKAGLAPAVLPLCACEREIAEGSLVLVDNQTINHPLYAFTQPHRGVTLATRTLLDFLSRRLRAVADSKAQPS